LPFSWQIPLEDIFTGGSDWAKTGAVSSRDKAIRNDLIADNSNTGLI
jgi:hypothetical protein